MNGKCQACPSLYGVRICHRCHIKLCIGCQRSHVSDNKNHIFEFPLYVCHFKCEQHNKSYFTSYCTECCILICDECHDDTHRGHKVESLLAAKKKAENRIRNDENIIQERLHAVRAVIQKVEDYKRDFEVQVRNIMSEIDSITGVNGLVYNLHRDAMDELFELQAGTQPAIEHVSRELDRLNDVETLLIQIQRVVNDIKQRQLNTHTYANYGDALLLDKLCQYGKYMTDMVTIPDVKQPILSDLKITYIKPTASEVKGLMFRIMIGENITQFHSGMNHATVVPTTDPRSVQPSLMQEKEDSVNKILKEATRIMHENIKALRLGCEKGSERIHLQQLPIWVENKDIEETVTDQQKHVLEIFQMYRLQNKKIMETEERLTRARESLRRQEKERSSETYLNSSRQRELEHISKATSDLERSLEMCRQNHDAACEELERSRKETEQWRTNTDELTNRLKAIELEIQQNNAELYSQRRENEALKKRLCNVNESGSLKQELEAMKTLNEKVEERLRTSQEETYKVKADLDKKKKENEDLKNRLSQLAGAKLMSGNASIADLGDKFRPTRIAEMFSEMYDNEWTDAVDNLSNRQRSEDLVANYLFVTLQACYKACSQLAFEQMEELVKALFYKMPHDQINTYVQCHMAEMKQLLDARKGVAVDIAIEAVKEISQSKTFMYEFRRYGNFDEGLVNQITRHQYFAKCTTVCWLMVVQDPPMVFDEEIPKGTPLDKDVYRPYTKSGTKVLFSVWPAMFLQQGGSLLVKGVAQCTN